MQSDLNNKFKAYNWGEVDASSEITTRKLSSPIRKYFRAETYVSTRIYMGRFFSTVYEKKIEFFQTLGTCFGSHSEQ